MSYLLPQFSRVNPGKSARAPEAAIESRLLADHAAGKHREVATAVIRAYGPEILGFLAAMLRDEDAARDVFSQFCEDLWTGLPRFRGHCSLRTWAYAVARNAASDYRDSAHNRRRCAIDEHPELLEAAQAARTTTLAYLRTEVKDRVAALRDRLDPEDQTMLILRIDRGMSFNDIARVTLGDAVPEDGATLARKSAALRKRFERIKAELRSLVRGGETQPTPAG
jgi:RNA polymerase sigma-70 factor (ECF subfamily)